MTNPDNIVRVRARNGGRASVYEANGWAQAYNSGLLEGNGVLQNTSADMNVLVGGSTTKPDVVLAENPAGYKVGLDIVGQQAVAITAPATNSRISAIVAYTDDLSLATTEDTITGSPASCGLIVVNGTAGSTPSAPTDNQIRTAITADGATGSQAAYAVVATILVASSTTTITNSLITNNIAKIGSQNIDFATYTATGYNEATIALNSSGQDICSLTIPSDGNYLIDGIVRVSSTGSTSATRNCWNQFTTSGTGTFSHSSEVGFAMNVQSGAVGCIATIPVKNVLKNAKAGDTVTLRSRTNAAASDISAALGVISAIRIG